MKSRKFYVQRGRFGNEYSLYYVGATEDFDVPETWERITRKEAERLAREERARRRVDDTFSGYASAEIYPAEAYSAEFPEEIGYHSIKFDSGNVYSLEDCIYEPTIW